MAVAAEVQVGTATIFGILGTITMTNVATSNAASRGLTDNFDMTEIASQNGSVVETVIYNKGWREVEVEFIPTGASRAAAVAVTAALLASTPGTVITIGGSTVTSFNGTYNYQSGASLKETREGVAVCGIKLRKYQTAADGAVFAALTVAS